MISAGVGVALDGIFVLAELSYVGCQVASAKDPDKPSRVPRSR